MAMPGSPSAPELDTVVQLTADDEELVTRLLGRAQETALAEFERALISERTIAGLASARARGRWSRSMRTSSK